MKRTNNQNNLYWKLLRFASKEMECTVDQLHELLKYLGDTPSSARLESIEFSHWIDIVNLELIYRFHIDTSDFWQEYEETYLIGD